MSSSEPSCVIHVLSARAAEDGSCRVRATVRSGELQVGQAFWFGGPQGERKTVTVASITRGGRYLEIGVSGEGAMQIRNGSYLYAMPE